MAINVAVGWFVAVVSALGILLSVQSEQILVSSKSDKYKLLYRICAIWLTVIQFCVCVISYFPHYDNPNDKSYVIVIRILGFLTVLISSFVIWAFGQATIDAAFRAQSHGKEKSPKWFQNIWKFGHLFNAFCLLLSAIVSFVIEILLPLWIYYVTFYIIVIVAGILFAFFGIKLRRGFTKLVNRFRTYSVSKSNSKNTFLKKTSADPSVNNDAIARSSTNSMVTGNDSVGAINGIGQRSTTPLYMHMEPPITSNNINENNTSNNSNNSNNNNGNNLDASQTDALTGTGDTETDNLSQQMTQQPKSKSKSIKTLLFEQRKLDIMITSLIIIVCVSCYGAIDLIINSHIQNVSIYQSPYPNSRSFVSHFILIISFISGLTGGLWVKGNSVKDPVYTLFTCKDDDSVNDKTIERQITASKYDNKAGNNDNNNNNNNNNNTKNNKSRDKNKSKNKNKNKINGNEQRNSAKLKQNSGSKNSTSGSKNSKEIEIVNEDNENEKNSMSKNDENTKKNNENENNDTNNNNDGFVMTTVDEDNGGLNDEIETSTESESGQSGQSGQSGNGKSKKHDRKETDTLTTPNKGAPNFEDAGSYTIRNQLQPKKQNTQSRLLKHQTTESQLERVNHFDGHQSALTIPHLHTSGVSETAQSASFAYVAKSSKIRKTTDDMDVIAEDGDGNGDENGDAFAEDDGKESLFEQRNDGEPLSPVYLDEITLSGKKKGKYDRAKVPRVNKNDEKRKENIRINAGLSIKEQKQRQAKDTHITFIQGRRDTYGSVTMPTVTLDDMTASIESDHDFDSEAGKSSSPVKANLGNYAPKHTKTLQDTASGASNYSNATDMSNDNEDMKTNENENDNDNGKAKMEKMKNAGKLRSQQNVFENLEKYQGHTKSHVSLIIYELDHVLVTMPEKLNKMDFNNWFSIDQFSLTMTFGGVDRVNSLKQHLNNIYNASIEHEADGSQALVCFVFTRRHSDTVYRILDSVGLIEFFRHFTKFNTELSHVVGFDHRLMQENNFRHHLVLLKLMRFLQKEHSSVLYIGHDKDTIDHLKNISLCQTYHVSHKGMTQQDLDKIEKKFFHIKKPKENVSHIETIQE